MSHTNPPSHPHRQTARQVPPAHGANASHNPDVAHEHSDVDVRTILSFAVALLLTVLIAAVLMGGLFKLLERQAAKNDPAVSPLTRPAVQMPLSQGREPVFGRGSTGPQLLTSEPTVLRKHRSEEEEALSTYGWVDEKTGVARIPIAEAKKLILQRGLPARAEAADPTLGTRRSAYGESSSGRVITAPEEQGTGEQTPPPAGEHAAPPGDAGPKPKG
jgi:hypothetical protein